MLPILREMSKLQDIAPVITNAVHPPGNHDAKASETFCSHFLGMQIPLHSTGVSYQPFIQLLTGARVIFCFFDSAPQFSLLGSLPQQLLTCVHMFRFNLAEPHYQASS